MSLEKWVTAEMNQGRRRVNGEANTVTLDKLCSQSTADVSEMQEPGMGKML